MSIAPVKGWESLTPAGVNLQEAYPAIIGTLAEHLSLMGESTLVSQLDRLFVASQEINGVADDFSFMVFPLPRLTLDQRRVAELKDERRISVDANGACIVVVVDDFEQIAWLYVTGLREMYFALQKAMRGFVPR